MANPKTFTEKKSTLETKRQQLAAKLAQLQAAERERQRKHETAQRLIVGRAVIAHAENNPDFAHVLAEILVSMVTRPDERKIIAELVDTTGEDAASSVTETETSATTDAPEKHAAPS